MTHISRKGFTLVELLIVMGILAILMTLGIASFQSARIKARDAKRKSDIATIVKSLEAYANDYNKYPTSTNGVIVCNPATGATCDWGQPFVDSKDTIYAATLPEETNADRKYRYESIDGVTYVLYAALENTKDPARAEVPGVSCSTSAKALLCNYRINSTNNISP